MFINGFKISVRNHLLYIACHIYILSVKYNRNHDDNDFEKFLIQYHCAYYTKPMSKRFAGMIESDDEKSPLATRGGKIEDDANKNNFQMEIHLSSTSSSILGFYHQI